MELRDADSLAGVICDPNRRRCFTSQDGTNRFWREGSSLMSVKYTIVLVQHRDDAFHWKRRSR